MVSPVLSFLFFIICCMLCLCHVCVTAVQLKLGGNAMKHGTSVGRRRVLVTVAHCIRPSLGWAATPQRGIQGAKTCACHCRTPRRAQGPEGGLKAQAGARPRRRAQGPEGGLKAQARPRHRECGGRAGPRPCCSGGTGVPPNGGSPQVVEKKGRDVCKTLLLKRLWASMAVAKSVPSSSWGLKRPVSSKAGKVIRSGPLEAWPTCWWRTWVLESKALQYGNAAALPARSRPRRRGQE